MQLHLKLLVICMLFLSSCGVLVPVPNVNSKFTSENVKLGMSKEEFILKFGKPFKESFMIDGNKVRHDVLYYKEAMGYQYVLNTIFRFENDILVSQEQGNEEKLYKTCDHSS